jgi:hypothetical protein
LLLLKRSMLGQSLAVAGAILRGPFLDAPPACAAGGGFASTYLESDAAAFSMSDATACGWET